LEQVKVGIDNIDNFVHLLKGKRVGLITNTTGVKSNLESTIDVLAKKIDLRALFAPEHGVRGNVQAGEKVENEKDVKTGIPVFTLYGDSKKPTKQMLENIDVLVFDMQDVGSRLYTYLYTMAYSMESAKEYKKEFIVLDRPNPLGGEVVEGNLVQKGYTSFIGLYPLPYRYGLTIGEMALLFNKEYNINCHLEVVKMQGWKRYMNYEDTGLPWILPSPNMPTVDTAFIYNATCIFEGTNISEGRGTTKPFEIIGAPWLDAYKLADSLNEKKLSGVLFRPAFFTPTFSKHKEKLCAGIQIHILNRHTLNSVQIALHLLKAVKMQNTEKFEYLPPYTEKGKHMIDYNTGTNYIRTHDFDPDAVYEQWQLEAKQFKELKLKYHLYD